VQANASDSTNNNMNNAVQIDAQRMVGVNRWESNNSRADLIVEDVRIADSQITKNITVAMVETDPGNVDYALYFNQFSLRNANSTSASTVSFKLRDGLAGVDPVTNPFGNLSVNGVAFKLGGTNLLIQDNATL